MHSILSQEVSTYVYKASPGRAAGYHLPSRTPSSREQLHLPLHDIVDGEALHGAAEAEVRARDAGGLRELGPPGAQAAVHEAWRERISCP